MMEDYEEKFYRPLAKRHTDMVDGNYALAREMAY